MNLELPDVQTGFYKDRRTGNQIDNIHWIIEKARKLQKKASIFCFIDYTKFFVCIRTNWKILKEMGIPGQLTCFLRNLYAAQETTVRTGHGTTDWFEIEKGVHKSCVLSLCLFTFYAEYILWNAGLDESQPGIRIAGININSLSYADDTILMAESQRN